MNNKKILIIDDDPQVCETLKHMAEFSGFDAIATDSAIAFFEQLALFEPDVIAVDLNMPPPDGVQLIHRLSELNQRAQLIIISGLGARVLEASAQSAIKLGLGVLGVLEKPFSPQSLRKLLTLYQDSDTPSLSERDWHQHVSSSDWVPTPDDLIHVVENDLINLNYQPKLDCKSGQLLGFEALARWNVPGHGNVAPSVFVPLAESSHLIGIMTCNIARKGIRWLSQIRAMSDSNQDLTLAINLSAKSLSNLDIPEQLAAECEQYQVPADRIILEVSESSTMKDPIALQEILTRFRIKNFRLSIDDFGTGYSSMLHLVRMPFTELKIDKAFVSKADTSDEALSVIRCIVDLSTSLGMHSVAEGVESESIRKLLTDLGCDAFQGYLVSPPMAETEVRAWISDYAPQAALTAAEV